MNRREILMLSSGAIAAVSVPAFAIAPAALAVWLGILSAGSAIAAAQRQAAIHADAQVKAAQLAIVLEKMRQTHEVKMRDVSMSNTKVRQDAMHDNSGNPARSVWSEDVDWKGTYLGISDGLIADARGKYEGTMSSPEAAYFFPKVVKGSVAMPVPVEDGYHSFSTRKAEYLHALFDNTMGKDAKLIAGRYYSVSSNPTTAGWDIESIMYSDNNNKVRTVTLERSLDKVA